MSKQEFMEDLRRSLSSINDYTFVNDTVSYYENYIESQMRMGKSEEEVLAHLGGPRLIAKSIKATHVSEGEESYQEFDRNGYENRQQYLKTLFSFNGKQINMPSWLAKTISILILVVVFWLIFTVLRWLAPFIMMGVVAYVVYKTFFGKY